jgi:hypothetical protein
MPEKILRLDNNPGKELISYGICPSKGGPSTCFGKIRRCVQERFKVSCDCLRELMAGGGRAGHATYLRRRPTIALMLVPHLHLTWRQDGPALKAIGPEGHMEERHAAKAGRGSCDSTLGDILVAL